jgi:hypothetical protein
MIDATIKEVMLKQFYENLCLNGSQMEGVQEISFHYTNRETGERGKIEIPLNEIIEYCVQRKLEEQQDKLCKSPT